MLSENNTSDSGSSISAACRFGKCDTSLIEIYVFPFSAYFAVKTPFSSSSLTLLETRSNVLYSITAYVDLRPVLERSHTCRC